MGDVYYPLGHGEEESMAEYEAYYDAGDGDAQVGDEPDRRPTDVWITKDGRHIPIAEMGDQHLFNTICMLRRWASKVMAVEDWDSTLMDVYFADKDWHNPGGPLPNDGIPINEYLSGKVNCWDNLAAEAGKRKLVADALTSPSDGHLIASATIAVIRAMKGI